MCISWANANEPLDKQVIFVGSEKLPPKSAQVIFVGSEKLPPKSAQERATVDILSHFPWQ